MAFGNLEKNRNCSDDRSRRLLARPAKFLSASRLFAGVSQDVLQPR